MNFNFCSYDLERIQTRSNYWVGDLKPVLLDQFPSVPLEELIDVMKQHTHTDPESRLFVSYFGIAYLSSSSKFFDGLVNHLIALDQIRDPVVPVSPNGINPDFLERFSASIDLRYYTCDQIIEFYEKFTKTQVVNKLTFLNLFTRIMKERFPNTFSVTRKTSKRLTSYTGIFYDG